MLDIDETYFLQEKIENDYKNNFLLTKQELIDLHMFFSPNRIVVGLTEKEVRLCIYLSKYRKEQKQLYLVFSQPSLHPSLMQNLNENIPREEGLKNALYEIMMELANHRPINES